MPSTEPPIYLNFDLRIEPWEGSYRSLVIDSPVQGGASSRISLSEQKVLRASGSEPRQPVSDHRRLVPATPVPAPQPAIPLDPRALGKYLFEAVFHGEVLSFLRRSQDEIARQGADGLRVRLLLTDVPELAKLPWELFYDPAHNQFLSLSTQSPVVRYLDVLQRQEPMATEPPLHVLVMISAPKDQPPLDVEEEWAKLNKALADLKAQGQVLLHRLDTATLAELQKQLRQGKYHIFHFMGHGAFDEQTQDGLLVLEDGAGASHLVSSQVLGTLLHDEPSLRLAVLNACEGARGSHSGPFAGTAQTLVQKGIPAVVAMQSPITDGAAKILAHEFYLALADGYPVDAALAEARKAIYRQGNEHEWGTPVLFMRSTDGILWQMAAREENQVADEREQPWWEGISVQSAGDVIIGFAGAGAQQTTIGKEITIILGKPSADDGQSIEKQFAQTEASLRRLGTELDPQVTMMAEFQLKLLRGELVKAGDGSKPSANTIVQVGDWLLDNVPQLTGGIQQLFAAPAVGRAMGEAGDEAVEWAKNRFGARG